MTTEHLNVNDIVAKPKLEYLVPEKHFQFAFLFLQKCLSVERQRERKTEGELSDQTEDYRGIFPRALMWLKLTDHMRGDTCTQSHAWTHTQR